MEFDLAAIAQIVEASLLPISLHKGSSNYII